MFALQVPSNDEEEKKKKKAAEDAAKSTTPVLSIPPPAPPTDDLVTYIQPRPQTPLLTMPTEQQPVTAEDFDAAYTNPTQAAPPPVLNPGAAPGTALAATTSRVPQLLAEIDKLNQNDAIVRNQNFADKNGNVNNPIKVNSRWKSALIALMQGFANNPRLANARSWADVAGGAAYAGGAGLGGAINQYHDEEQKRAEILAENAQKRQELEGQVKLEQDVDYKNAQIRDKEVRARQGDERISIAQRQLKDREARTALQKLTAEQKAILEPIFKRGYFYDEDTDPATLEKMRQMGIILPDFDNRKKDIRDNGVLKTYDAATRSYRPVDGVETDPDDVRIPIMINGQQYEASTKHVLGYLAAKERQEDQQAFTLQRDANQMQFRSALEQYKAANGRLKTVEMAAAAFKKEYYKKNGVAPDQATVDAYITGTIDPLLGDE